MFYDESRPPIVLLPNNDEEIAANRSNPSYSITGSAAKARFREFFRNFRLGTVYPYRDALIRHWNRAEYFVDVDVSHLLEYDEILYNQLRNQPDEILPYFEAAAKESLKLFLTDQNSEQISQNSIPDFQIILKSQELDQPLRTLSADHVNQLIKVSVYKFFDYFLFHYEQ